MATVGELEKVGPDTGARLRDVMAGPRAWIRDLATKKLLEPGFEPVYGLSMEEHRERIRAQVEALAGTAMTKVGFPTSVGGSNDPGSFVTGFEMLSYGDVSLQVKVGVHFGLFGGAIQHLGNAQHLQEMIPGVMDFTKPGCFAMTETGHGSDVQSLRTTATYDPATESFDLHTPDLTAWKDYIGNAAAHAIWAVVFAQLETGGEGHGVHAFLVRIREDDGTVRTGVTIGDNGEKLGLNGVDNGRIAFDHVAVPRTDLLNRFGDVAADGTYTSPIENPSRRFFTMLGTLVQGRVAVSGGAVSAAKLALTIATRHAYTRAQFEGADEGSETLLMDYLSHQRRLFPRIARTYALHFAQQNLLQTFHEAFTTPDYPEEQRRRLETLAAGTKALSTWHATDSIQEAREACGGFGYLSENRLGQLKSDLDVYTTFEGDNTVLMQLVAKSLLTNFKEDMGAMDTPELVMFGAEQVVDQVIEWSRARQLMQSLVDAVPGREDDQHLLDRGWQLKMFARREEDLLQSVAMRLRSLAKDRTPFEAFNHCQDHVLTAAHAHMERVVLEAFIGAIEDVEDAGAKQILSTLCDLHALSVIERERAWYQEHGFITANRSKAVIGTVNGLCRDLRPYAQLLARSMGVPDELVRAPIALRHHGEPYLAARERLGL